MRNYPRPPPEVSKDGTELYEVEKIVDQCYRRGVLKYKIRWKGYPSSEDIWKDAGEMEETCPDVVEAWNASISDSRKKRLRKLRDSSSSSSSEHNDSQDAEVSNENPIGTNAMGQIETQDRNITRDMENNNQDPVDIEMSLTSEDPMDDCPDFDVSPMSSDDEDITDNHSVPVFPHSEATRSVNQKTIINPDEKNETLLNFASESAKSLREMIENKEVEVLFRNFRTYSEFDLPHNFGDITVHPGVEFPLSHLVEETIEFLYAGVRRLDTEERHILVGLKNTNKHFIVDYPLKEFCAKFKNVCLKFLDVVNDYRRIQTEISNRIDYYQRLVTVNRDVWKNYAYNEIGELLSDEQVVPYLPELYKTPDKPPEMIVLDFLNELMDNTEKLYFFKLAKEYGKAVVTSCGVPTTVERIEEVFNSQEDWFQELDKKVVFEWRRLWNDIFKIPS